MTPIIVVILPYIEQTQAKLGAALQTSHKCLWEASTKEKKSLNFLYTIYLFLPKGPNCLLQTVWTENAETQNGQLPNFIKNFNLVNLDNIGIAGKILIGDTLLIEKEEEN